MNYQNDQGSKCAFTCVGLHTGHASRAFHQRLREARPPLLVLKRGHSSYCRQLASSRATKYTTSPAAPPSPPAVVVEGSLQPVESSLGGDGLVFAGKPCVPIGGMHRVVQVSAQISREGSTRWRISSIRARAGRGTTGTGTLPRLRCQPYGRFTSGRGAEMRCC